MNRLFNWKERKEEILSKCLQSYGRPGSLEENDYCVSDEEEEAQTDDSDDDDFKLEDNSVFETSAKIRKASLKLFPENDSRLQRWRELTDINPKPVMFGRRILKSVGDNTEGSDLQMVESGRRKSSFCGDRKMTASSETAMGTIDKGKTSSKLNGLQLIFKIQYLIITERLKVTIVQAKNLSSKSNNPAIFAANVEVCLLPGKFQREVTPICKGSNSPVFNSVMYFKDFPLESIVKMNLRLRVFGREQDRRPLKMLGEVVVALSDFDIIGETVLCESAKVSSKIV